MQYEAAVVSPFVRSHPVLYSRTFPRPASSALLSDFLGTRQRVVVSAEPVPSLNGTRSGVEPPPPLSATADVSASEPARRQWGAYGGANDAPHQATPVEGWETRAVGVVALVVAATLVAWLVPSPAAGKVKAQ